MTSELVNLDMAVRFLNISYSSWTAFEITKNCTAETSLETVIFSCPSAVCSAILQDFQFNSSSYCISFRMVTAQPQYLLQMN